MANITVFFKNNSSFDNTYEYEDNVCPGPTFKIGIASGGRVTRTICSSGATDSGYGSINYRKEGNSSWTQKNLIDDGDEVWLA